MTFQEKNKELKIKFTQYNYNYVWLKAMLAKDQIYRKNNPTLITGSSHALNGIKSELWDNVINCSMHSQDIYYDFMCAKEVIKEKDRFSKCFIVLGYYIAYQDLSLSKVSRESMIRSVYYPVFGDSHNWKEPLNFDLWSGIPDVSEDDRIACEKAVIAAMAESPSYYSELNPRKPLFDLKGRTWSQISESERDLFGKCRTDDHNRICTHKASFDENKEIMKDFVHFLHMNGTMPIVVVTPFTSAYNRYISRESKESLLELLNSVPEEVHYVDLNDCDYFDNSDFMDTDHLNEKGAEKVSRMLVNMFGK